MLAFGRGFGELFRKFKQAAVVGEIIAGIILGPTIFGNISPEFYSSVFPETGAVAVSINALVSLSIIFLLLVVGFEVDLGIVLQQGRSAITIGTAGMIFPFILGGAAAYLLPDIFGIFNENKWIFPFFLGTSLAISALPIIARTLIDLNLFKTRFGMTTMAAAMFNDFTGWIIFSIFLSLAGTGSHGYSVGVTIGLTFLFVFLILFVFRRFIHRSLLLIQSKFSWPGGIIAFVMVLALTGAIITEEIGIHSIFGAFIMGVAIGDSVHLSERTKEIVNQFITNIFAPLFFVSIGLRANFIASFDVVIVLLVLLIGFSGKIIGAGLGAFFSGFNKSESMSVGAAMNARGVLEIVLGLFALNNGLINEEIFVAIIVLVLLSSILSGPLISHFSKESRSYTFADLIDSKYIIFSNAQSKETEIKLLANIVSSKNKVESEEIFNKVWKREELIPTGIANYLAIPHAKVNVNKPVIAIAVNKKGLNFDAPDKLPAKIILLLLTPENKNELQLQLLAEIANKFKNKENVEELINSSTEEEFISKLKQVM